MMKSRQKEWIPEIVRLYTVDYCSISQIAYKSSSCKKTISAVLKKQGIAVKTKHDRRLELIDQLPYIISEYDSGKSLAKIANEISSTKITLSAILKDAGIKIKSCSDYEYNIKRPYCGVEFVAGKPHALCIDCRKKKDREYQRKIAGYELGAVAICKYCDIEMPDVPINRKYCDVCRPIRSKHNKKRAWKNNPKHYRMMWRKDQHNRRANKYGAGAVHLHRDHFVKLEKIYDNKCIYCGALNNLTIDHVLALSRGGTNEFNNLVIACLSCNSSKRDKMLLNFLWNRYKSLRSI